MPYQILQVWFQNARAKYRRWTSNLETKANEAQIPETTDNQVTVDTSGDIVTMEEPTQSSEIDPPFD